MKELIDKGFNEIFLNEISKFDGSKYAYDTFFNCDTIRFSKIARFYGKHCGSSALNYMRNTFYSWKNGTVKPNGGSTFNIIASASSTFTFEEKFVNAYTQLAKHIKNAFPKKIQLNEINSTFNQIVNRINSFNLEENLYYSKYIYNRNELIEYQSNVKDIFKFYTKTIFDNLNKDIELFIKVYKDINTSFLTTSFYTYLFNIEICIHNVINKKIDIHKVFDIDGNISYESLFNSKINNISIKQIIQISQANENTKIDAFLTGNEIENIVNRKTEIEKSNLSGTINLFLKTNSGLLKIFIQILSPKEKFIIYSRVALFFVIFAILINYYLVQTSNILILVCVLLVSSFLILPIYDKIINLFKDIIKSKCNGRK